MTSARALRVPQHGSTNVLRVDSIEVPAPGPGEVRVRVEASGVNFIDVYQRTGIYPIPTPFTLGFEGAGVVESVGSGVELDPGIRVAWAMRPGSAAELVVLPATAVVKVPDGVTGVQAAAAMLQGMTAHFLVNSTYAVQPGDTVLVHAAAGGVGQWLVQLCARKDATVIATAGSPEKLNLARELGAAHTVDYSQFTGERATDELAKAVRDATRGVGVHVAYDGVGMATFDASLASLRRRGMLVLFGGASGQVPPFDLQRLNAAGSIYVTRPSLAHYVGERDELLWRAREVFAALRNGAVRMQIGGQWPLEEAAAAYEMLESRRSTGKLVLTIGETPT